MLGLDHSFGEGVIGVILHPFEIFVSICMLKWKMRDEVYFLDTHFTLDFCMLEISRLVLSSLQKVIQIFDNIEDNYLK